MRILNIFSLSTLKLFFFLMAILECVFGYGIRFSSHRTLIRRNLIRIDKYGISRYFHSFCKIDDISHQYQILMKLDQLSIPSKCYFLPLIRNWVQLSKLPLFRIIINCSHQGTNSNSNQHNKSLDPCMRSIISICCTHFDHYRKDAGSYQDFHHKIIKRLNKQLPKGWHRSLVFLITAIFFLSLF